MASNINQIERSALVYVKDIGRGAFSTVYEMTWRSPDGPLNVAAKRLNSKDKNELEVLSELDHPNIIKLIGVVDEGTDFMLVLELCEGGSLRSYLKARKGRRLPDKQFYDWAEQASRPLEYLRENKLVHKDVKSDNYMVTSQNTLKLGDFGLAKNIDQTVGKATTTASYNWMAPELLLKGILSPKYDIFALAVVLWELWTGKFPWEGVHSPTIVYKVCTENERLPIPEDCPEPIKDLLRQCWQAEWKQRPDIIQVLHVITAAAAQESRQRRIIAGPWTMVREFGQQDGPGMVYGASHMTLSPHGDVVIAERASSRIQIYSLDGGYKSTIHHQREPWHIVVTSDNTCYMTDRSQYITMFDLNGKYKGRWVSSCPDALSSAPVLYGLAIDHAGDVLLGDIQNRFIYQHRQDGAHVGIEPWRIAVTSQGTIIVIAIDDNAPQVISNTGQVLHTLRHHVGESEWRPWQIYCHSGIIFVCNQCSILCYSESAKYFGSMAIPNIHPDGGIAMTSDNKTLLVCKFDSIKVFTAP